MKTVGELLQTERINKGLSLKDIENAINIRVLYLDAIEKGDYHIIPGEVYLKGFIRNYANFLGLNGPELVEIYRNKPSSTVPVITSAVEPPPAPPAQLGKNSLKKPRALAAGVIVLFTAVGAWWSLSSPTSLPEKLPTSTPQAQISSSAVSTVKQDEIQTPIVITAKFSDQCWTLITADGKEIYEGTPKNGETMTWKAKQNLVIKVGNADAIDLIFNGKNINKIGGKGEVIVKTFSLNSAEKP